MDATSGVSVTDDSDRLASRPRVKFTGRSATFIGSVNLVAQVVDRLVSFGQIAVIAAFFGSRAGADLYFLVSIVPLTLGSIIGEPIGRAFFTEIVRSDDRAEQLRIASAGVVVCAAVVSVLSLLYAAIAFPLVREFVPSGIASFNPWLAFIPAGVAFGLNGYLHGILVWLERYGWAAARFPLASFAGLAFMGIAVSESRSVTPLALAVSLGFWVTTIALAAAVSSEIGARWVFAADRDALRRGFALLRVLLAPWAGALLGGQVIVLVERILAASLAPGAVAILSYTRGLAAAPAVVGQALGAATYPAIVRADAAHSHDYIVGIYLRGLRVVLFTGIVFACFFALFGGDVFGLLLERGQLGTDAVRQAAVLLLFFGLSTFATGIVVYAVQVAYGIARFGVILHLEASVFVAYVVLAVVLRSTIGLNGLALAFALAQTLGAVVGLVLIGRRTSVGLMQLLRDAVLPVVVPVAAAVGALGLFRLGVEMAGIAVSARGAIRNAGSIVVLALGLAAYLLAPVPEARTVRRRLVRLARSAPATKTG